MTYEQLLETIPVEEMEEEDWETDMCPTCLEHGFCRDRASTLTHEVSALLLHSYNLAVDDAVLLQWLLDTDAIGLDRDEDYEQLARQYAGDDD